MPLFSEIPESIFGTRQNAQPCRKSPHWSLWNGTTPKIPQESNSVSDSLEKISPAPEISTISAREDEPSGTFLHKLRRKHPAADPGSAKYDSPEKSEANCRKKARSSTPALSSSYWLRVRPEISFFSPEVSVRITSTSITSSSPEGVFRTVVVVLRNV